MQFKENNFKGGILTYDANNKLIESWTGGIANLRFEEGNLVFDYAERTVVLSNQFAIEVCYSYDDAVAETKRQRTKA